MSLLERLLKERSERLDALGKYYKECGGSEHDIILDNAAAANTSHGVGPERTTAAAEQEKIEGTVESNEPVQGKLDVTRDLKMKVNDQLKELKRRTDAAIRRELRQRITRQAD